MNLIFKAAQEISGFFDSQGWNFCIIGGLANQCRGEPRTTHDVDLTLLTGVGSEQYFAEKILASFNARIDGALEFSLKNRVLLIQSSNGIPLDISFGALPFEEEMISRASHFEFMEGVKLKSCSAEDLFIMKAFASRPKDWIDAEGIEKRQKGSLDRIYIMKHLEILAELKEEPEIISKTKKILGMK